MRILKDFKMPNFKFPKFKMQGLSEIDEVKVDYEKIKNEAKKEKRNKPYEDPTNYKTIKEVFMHSLECYPDNACIMEKPNHKDPYITTTYQEFGNEVNYLGTALMDLLGKNARVVIIGENSHQWYLAYMTMLCGDGMAVPVDKELPENEIENVVKRANADAVIYSSKKKDVIKKIEANLPNVKYFIQMNSEEDLEGRTIGLNYLLEEGKKIVENGNDSFSKIEIDPEEFKVLIFTSGTTSNSKGVMICNRNLAENINAVSYYVKIFPTDRFLSILPLHHTYESTIGFLLPIANGSSIAVCEGLKYIVPNLKEAQPTALLTVPLLVENLYRKINDTIKKSKKDGLVNSMIHVTNALKAVNVDIKRKVFKEIYDNLGGKIRIIVSAAAPIDAKVGKWVEDIGISFLQGYGLTETAPIAALTPEYDPRVGSIGKPVVGTEIRIENPNENGEGEIFIKGPTVMLGYYEDENATAEAITDGWFHSGDIGYMDQDGYIYITGRSKNVIVTQNGKNIYPEEIELMLSKIKEIKECMIYGKEASEDSHDKELIITARVIPDREYITETYGKEMDEDEIYKIIWNKIKEVNKGLTSYKAIKKLEIKKDEFEKTTTMKIKRYVELKKDTK